MERSRSTSPKPIFARRSLPHTPVSKIIRGTLSRSMTQPDAFDNNRPPRKENETVPYHQHLPSRSGSNKPLFRLQNSRQRFIKTETEEFSEESSGDIRPNMANLKSPKMTGNFAAAYRYGNEPLRSNRPSLLTLQNYDSSDQVQNVSKKIKTESSLNSTVEDSTVGHRIRNDILDDWTELECSQVKIRKRSPTLSSTDSKEIPSIASKLHSSVTKLLDPDLKKDILNTNGMATVNMKRIDVDVDDVDEDNKSNQSDVSQVTLPYDYSEFPERLPEIIDTKENEDTEVFEIPPSPIDSTVASRLSRKRTMSISSETDKITVKNVRRPSSTSSSPTNQNNNSESCTKSQTALEINLEKSRFKGKSRETLKSEKDGANYDVNIRLTKNMDMVRLDLYLKWLWRNYRSRISCNSSVDIIPLLKKILQQPEVHYLMEEKIKNIRENVYLMETKSVRELFNMVSEVVKKIIENDFEQVTKVYHTTLNLFTDQKT